MTPPPVCAVPHARVCNRSAPDVASAHRLRLQELTAEEGLVLGVNKPDKMSITMSIPLINAAQLVRRSKSYACSPRIAATNGSSGALPVFIKRPSSSPRLQVAIAATGSNKAHLPRLRRAMTPPPPCVPFLTPGFATARPLTSPPRTGCACRS